MSALALGVLNAVGDLPCEDVLVIADCGSEPIANAGIGRVGARLSGCCGWSNGQNPVWAWYLAIRQYGKVKNKPVSSSSSNQCQ